MRISDEDRQRIQDAGRTAGSMLRIHDVFRKQPIIGSAELSRAGALSAPTVNAAVAALSELGIIREITGRKRNRVFVYDRYLAVLERGLG